MRRILTIFGTARIVCGTGSTHLSGVRLSVRPSVNLSVSHTRPQHAAAAGLLLWARRAKDIDRLLHSRRAAGECGQCHIVNKKTYCTCIEM